MAKKKALLTVSVDGEGISPKDISLRQLVALLEAMAAAVEAVAAEENVDAPMITLAMVRDGSAAYEMSSASPEADEVVRSICEAVQTRGAGRTHETRTALKRLHEAGRMGVLKLAPRPGLIKTKKALLVSAPLEVPPEVHEIGTEVYGRIVGLFVRGEQTVVRLKLADGAAREVPVIGDAEMMATKLFNKHVRARLVIEVTDEDERALAIESLTDWGDDDLLDALRDLRDDFASAGKPIDAGAWLKELES